MDQYQGASMWPREAANQQSRQAAKYLIKLIAKMGSGVAQLAEWSLPIPEVRRFESRHRQFFIEHLGIYCHLYCIEKTKIKEKEAGNGAFKKRISGRTICAAVKDWSHQSKVLRNAKS